MSSVLGSKPNALDRHDDVVELLKIFEEVVLEVWQQALSHRLVDGLIGGHLTVQSGVECRAVGGSDQ